MVIISFVTERETSMTLQPSLQRLRVMMQLEEDDAEIDLGIAQLLQQRRRRAPRRHWIRPWIRRRTDFGHYDRLMRELEAEDHKAFTNFLRVPPGMFRELEERLTPRLLKQDTGYMVHESADPQAHPQWADFLVLAKEGLLGHQSVASCQHRPYWHHRQIAHLRLEVGEGYPWSCL